MVSPTIIPMRPAVAMANRRWSRHSSQPSAASPRSVPRPMIRAQLPGFRGDVQCTQKRRSSEIRAASPAAGGVVPGENTGDSNAAKQPGQKVSKSRMMDGIFQQVLWSSRYFVLAAVIGSLVMSALMFLQGTAGVIHCFQAVVKALLAGHLSLEEPDVALACVEILDKFLAGIITFIFGTGIYSLFISQIKGGTSDNGQTPGWLMVNGIEEMEMRLGKVVITILVVNLMASAKKVVVSEPFHLVWISLALFFAALAMTVLHWVDSQH